MSPADDTAPGGSDISPISMLDLRAQLDPIRDELEAALREVLDHCRFIDGPQVGELERKLAARCGCEEAVGVSSGTDALLCTLMALGVGPGDEVITTPYTFFATAGSIWRTGARPVFVDIELQTFNMDPGLTEAAVTSRTRGLLPVHLFGQMADMDPLMEVARARGLFVVEDAAQSMGATCGGRRAGSVGTAGCFSFFPSKNLGGLGDGGMVVTRDSALAERLRVLRAHGARPKHLHHHVGGNFRLDTLQAAALLVGLRHLDAWTASRQRHAARYDALLAGIPEVKLPEIRGGSSSVFNQYVIRVPRRDELRARLDSRGIGTALYYPRGLHLQPCLASLGHREGDFPQTEQAAAQTLALPVHPALTEAQILRVASAVAGFYGRSI